MEESNIEISPPVRRIIQRKNRGVVPVNPSPRTSGLASKAVVAAAAAGLFVGGAKLVDNVSGAEAASDQAHVTTILQPHVQETNIQEVSGKTPTLFDTVFHDLNPNENEKARLEVQEFKDRILAKQDYQHEYLEIPIKYKDIIEQTATAYGISTDTLMGLIGTENGGGTNITNQISGAMGVAQFMPETARQYGLKVGGGVDQRADPVLSIDAAGRYLRDTKALFGGDEGLALWSYHAGPGNVFKALEIYFLDVDHVDIGDYGKAIGSNNAQARQDVERKAKEHIAQNKLDISKLLANPKVKVFAATLEDYSETYPRTVVAMSQIIREHLGQAPVHDLGGGLRVSVADKPVSNTFSR